ncbi:hypothetical protein [Clostridium sp.]|uniref:hypothetical protein n=2 Tax=Clostridium sp. TaxID=1506 RepID=UPI001A3EA930|nr:hypothetical protein [Clostridium sp.]MBK5240249.1 hypothetical protein [Clostridium sp.]
MRMMSRFNTDVICIECNDEEKKHPLYKEACDKEVEEVRLGNYNYGGLFEGQTYPFNK